MRKINFKQFKESLQENFQELTENVDHLFEVNLDKDELWDLYLDSFPEGVNKTFRERREYDCSCCRQFIKNIGNAVSIKNNTIETIWDFETNDDTFQPVVNALSNYVKSHAITDIFITDAKKMGTDKNLERTDSGEVIEWQHFFLNLPKRFVIGKRDSIASIKGSYRDTKNVFKRSLDEITTESVLTVLELISQNSLYKGEEWEYALNQFLEYKKSYEKLENDGEKEKYAWKQSVTAGSVIGKIRNHSIGTLLVNISEGMELDTAVTKYESITAPHNYKRPKAIYTKKMLDDAKKKVQELGYMDSLERRFATLDDITVNNILFSNKDVEKKIKRFDVFDEMAEDVPLNPKQFSKVEEINAEDFVNNVLPHANEVEAFLENRHANNMVSLIAPQNKESNTMFKWDNGFSWAYSGNITDSSMKERVKSAGGNVEGVLRFSIQWNDGHEHDKNDLDAHCHEPSNNLIYYNNKIHPRTTGNLDVDITDPKQDKPAVENITWTDINKMEEGKYQFLVHNYAHRGGKNGFKAEIEFDGQVYTFEYNQNIQNRERIPVAEVYFDKDEGFSIKENLPSDVSSKEVWNVKTNQFIPVSVAMFSPNYWDSQQGIGHRHYFFMLNDCVNPERPNSFYNEFLKHELNEHKRVFEALAGKLSVEDSDDQLSGVGFSSTKRNDLLVKVKGTMERVMRIKF